MALLACKGDSECRATFVYQGVTGPGTGKTKAEALQGACWGYCGKDDPVVDDAWKDWKKRGGISAGSKMADLTDQPALKPVHENCQRRCKSDIAAGKGTISYGDNCQ